MIKYKPPFEMNEQIATLTAEIAELSGGLNFLSCAADLSQCF